MQGIKAKESSAYDIAYKYLSIGIDLLQINCWEQEYDLTLKLYNQITEVALFCGYFEVVQKNIKLY